MPTVQARIQTQTCRFTALHTNNCTIEVTEPAAGLKPLECSVCGLLEHPEPLRSLTALRIEWAWKAEGEYSLTF